MTLFEHGEGLRILKKENKDREVGPTGQEGSTQHPYSLPPSVPRSPLPPLCCPGQCSRPPASCQRLQPLSPPLVPCLRLCPPPVPHGPVSGQPRSMQMSAHAMLSLRPVPPFPAWKFRQSWQSPPTPGPAFSPFSVLIPLRSHLSCHMVQTR